MAYNGIATPVAYIDANGNQVPVTAANPLPTAGGGGGGSTDITTLAKEAKQDTGNTTLGNILVALATQATAARQDTGNTSLATLAGQVVDLTATGSITTQNLAPGGVATAGSSVALNVAGRDTLNIQVTGTYTGTISVQGTLDGTNWVTVGGNAGMNLNTGGSISVIPSAIPSIYQYGVGAYASVRVSALAAWTGTAVITLRAVDGNSLVALDAALPGGNNSIGNLGSITNNVNTVETAAPTITTAPTQIVLSTTSATVAASLTTRKSVIIFNSGTVPAYLAFAATATSTTGYTLQLAVGATTVIPRETWTGVISGIATAAGSVQVTVTS